MRLRGTVTNRPDVRAPPKPRRAGILGVAALVLAAALPACRSARGEPLQDKGGQRFSAEEVWSVLQKAGEKAPKTMTATAKAFVDAKVNGGKYALQISVKAPRSLRIEALTPLGDPAAVLVTDEGRFALFDLRRSQFFRGPSTPENLSRLFPVPLRDEELVALFLGRVPELPGGKPVRWEDLPGQDAFRMTTSQAAEGQQAPGALVQEAVISSGDRRLLEVRRYPATGSAKQPLWTVGLEDHDDSSGSQLPRVVKLAVPAEGILLDLRIREQMTGKPPPYSAFAIQPPKGVEVVELN